MNIKHILLLATMLTLVSPAIAAKAPNVLFLMSDDLNTALSGFGHPQCKTPELDKLAERGMRFENMHWPISCVRRVARIADVRALSLHQRNAGQCRDTAGQHAGCSHDVAAVQKKWLPRRARQQDLPHGHPGGNYRRNRHTRRSALVG